MLEESPFTVAARRAAEEGVCPVNLLDAFYTNHADFDSLCSEFTCRECVATPEDMGFGEWEPSPEPDSEVDLDEAIPF